MVSEKEWFDEDIDINIELKKDLDKVAVLPKQTKNDNLSYIESFCEELKKAKESFEIGINQDIVINVLADSIQKNKTEATDFVKFSGMINRNPDFDISVDMQTVAMPSIKGDAVDVIELVFKPKNLQSVNKLIDKVTSMGY